MPARWYKAALPAEAADLAEHNADSWLAEILARRGVSNADAAERFLTPDVAHLHDPFGLLGMDRLVELLVRAGKNGDPIAIVGDYDADGVTATALLVAVLRKTGVEVLPILPDRLREGYGFLPVHVRRAHQAGCRLILTADCGTNSVAAAEVALELGVAVAVSDHHLPTATLPDPVLLINPHQPGCSYPFRHLSGAGLAFKICQGLITRLKLNLELEPLLRIASLGTVADMVPLLGENRVLAALGLEAMGETRSPGLRALFRAAGVKPPVSALDIAFRLAPRLNAAGRVASPDAALELLLCTDAAEAGRLARRLDEWNEQRRQEEKRVVDQARDLFAGADLLPKILIACSADWHRGVVGIAAGRLAREFHRPVVLLSQDGDSATGSGRSIPSIHLHQFLDGWRDQLERFGGHSQAVGLTLAVSRLPELRKEWEEASSDWESGLLEPQYEYEIQVSAGGEEADLEAMYRRLQPLAPFGAGNPSPVLRLDQMSASSLRRFGNGHLEVIAGDVEGRRRRLVAWNWAQREEMFRRPFEALGTLEHDSYHGEVVVRLVDARAAD